MGVQRALSDPDFISFEYMYADVSSLGKFIKLYIFSMYNANKKFWKKTVKARMLVFSSDSDFFYTSCQQGFIKPSL